MRSSNWLKIGLGVLVVTNLATLGWMVYSGGATKRAITTYPLIDFARNFIKQENYITTLQPLREKLRGMAEDHESESVSVYIEFLNTGANISINQDSRIWPVSLAKIPLALTVMHKIENGDWRLNNELVLMPGDSNDESGDVDNPLDEFPIGTRFTIEKLLSEMLINSDNTAYYILLRNTHEDERDKIVEDLGLEGLFTEDGRVSAKEYSRFFRALYTASFINREHSQMILRWLDESPFDDFLSSEIPSEIPFSHKYGENIDLNVYSDSGIVYLPDRPYLITVMVQGKAGASYAEERQKAVEFMQEVSMEVYSYLSSE